MTVAHGVAQTPPNLDPLSRSKQVPTIKCPYCPKVFKRSEHCARHELSHTNEKPYSCQFCHKTYARKDLVKRHERTIHADLYNALIVSDDSGRRPSAAARELLTTRSDPAPPELDCHAAQASGHGSHLEDTSLDNEDVLHAPDEIPTDSIRRASLQKSDTAPKCTANSAPCTQPLPDFLANDPTFLGNPDIASSGEVREVSAAVYTRNSGSPPPPLVPGSNYEHPNFSLVDVLTPSCFDPFTAPDSRMDDLEPEQPPSKRQRRNDDASVVQENHSGTTILGPLPTSSFVHEIGNLPAPTDLGTFGLGMGDATDNFFFQHFAEQHDRFIDTLRHGDLSTMGPYQTTWLKPGSDASFSGRSADSRSDCRTDDSGRKRVPMIRKEKPEKLPHLTVHEDAFRAFAMDVGLRLGGVDTSPVFKSRSELQHSLNGYLNGFHQHLPIVHLPSLDVARTPSPLILAMCCIGALYRLERQKARHIYFKVIKILETMSTIADHSFPDRTTTSTWFHKDQQPAEQNLRPLWWMQTRYLLLLYATLGSDTTILQSELDKIGIVMTDYRTRRSALRSTIRLYREPQWHVWIEIETTKRLLCAIFILSSLMVLLYDIPPGFGITRDLEIELLDEEKLWNAANEEQWRQLRGSEPAPPTRTIRDVMEDMLSGKTDNSISSNNSSSDSPYYVSGFTSLVVIHGATIFAWNISQLCHVNLAPLQDLSGVGAKTLLANALTTLARCSEILEVARSEGTEPYWNSPEGPLLLNCEAMLRVAYSRLFLNSSMPEGIILFLSDTACDQMLADFVAAPQERSPLITKVMASMCEAFTVPSKAGYMLVQKTAAIHWSVEHAIAGWNCVFVLSKWLHNLETSPAGITASSAELEIIAQVKTALEGMEIEYDGSESLAAAVVASWAPLMTDVWVWSVTVKMGTTLLGLAQAYRRSFNNATRRKSRG